MPLLTKRLYLNKTFVKTPFIMNYLKLGSIGFLLLIIISSCVPSKKYNELLETGKNMF